MQTAPITALIITKNEARGIERCIRALRFCDQVIVIDSGSTDGTPDLARAEGATVLDFRWNGHYPKKKQWAMERKEVRNDWVLHIDGDEVVTDDLATELLQVAIGSSRYSAYDVPLSYVFSGKPLKFGHRVQKRSFVKRSRSRFPEVGDLQAPGITEVEGHYQPIVDGEVGRLSNTLLHDDPDPLADWISRHNRYSDWEAYLVANPRVKAVVKGNRSKGGQVFDQLPMKPLTFFIYSYIVRLGFLDGRPGFDYAYALSFYYWQISAKIREGRIASEVRHDDRESPRG